MRPDASCTKTSAGWARTSLRGHGEGHAPVLGGGGASRPMCNSSEHNATPRMPDGFEAEADKDGWRH